MMISLLSSISSTRSRNDGDYVGRDDDDDDAHDEDWR